MLFQTDAFSLEKQKSFVPEKKIFFKPLSISKQKSFVTDPIFSEGFATNQTQTRFTFHMQSKMHYIMRFQMDT